MIAKYKYDILSREDVARLLKVKTRKKHISKLISINNKQYEQLNCSEINANKIILGVNIDKIIGEHSIDVELCY